MEKIFKNNSIQDALLVLTSEVFKCIAGIEWSSLYCEAFCNQLARTSQDESIEFSSLFGFTPIENVHERKFSLKMGYLVRFFGIVLFVPNSVKFYQSIMVDLDMDIAMDCLIFMSAHFVINTQILCGIWKSKSLRRLSSTLANGIESRKETASGKFYSQMESLYFLIHKWFFIVMFVSTLTFMIPSLIITLYNVGKYEQMSKDSWLIPIKVSLPFKVDSLPIYMFVFMTTAFTMWAMAICKTTITEIFYRYELHLIARCDDLEFQLRCIPDLHQKYLEGSDCLYEVKMQSYLRDIIDFYQNIVDFFQLYSEVTSGIIFFEFIALIGLLVGAGSSMAKQSSIGDLNVLKCNFAVISAAGSLFISSKMGNEVSHKLGELTKAAYSSGWENLPSRFRRYALILLMNTQRPRKLSGFGLVNCDLETFGEMNDKTPMMKYASLVALTLQNAFVALSLRHGRIRVEKDKLFYSSTAVIMTELIKLVVSLVFVFLEERYSLKRLASAMNKTFVENRIDTLKVFIPSFLYVIQNNLMYLAASHLDSATYQVSYQFTIITTAVLAVLILRRRLLFTQWGALYFLIAGITIIQLTDHNKVSTMKSVEQNHSLGFSAAIFGCVLSGFTNVYFEKMLKVADISIWMRNVQMSLLSIPLGIATCLVTDFRNIKMNGFFHGYDYFVIYLVVLQACGGLLVGLVMRYADTILKGFATSSSIIISCFASIYLFDFDLSAQFGIGVMIVTGSIFLYGHEPAPFDNNQRDYQVNETVGQKDVERNVENIVTEHKDKNKDSVIKM